jgi:hypothetical protein
MVSCETDKFLNKRLKKFSNKCRIVLILSESQFQTMAELNSETEFCFQKNISTKLFAYTDNCCITKESPLLVDTLLLSNRREMYHMGIKICKNVCTLCPLYCPDQGDTKERSKSVTDPLIIPHPSRLSSAELPVLCGPKRSLLIDGANPYHFRSIQCFGAIY